VTGPVDAITMCGTPEQLGLAWGTINAARIREHFAAFLERSTDRGVDEAELLTRCSRAVGLAEELAPHWRVESHAAAEAAGVPADLYFAYHLAKYRDLVFWDVECTSYAATGSATRTGAAAFHKSRDNTTREQAGYTKHQELTGDAVHAFVSIGDTSDTGVMMMVNDAGLCASADTGAPDPNPFHQGLMNPWGLRYLAEYADDCHQALAILQEWVDERIYAGSGRATNWMLADAAGNVLRVVNFSDHLEPELIDDGFLLNYERTGLREFMGDRTGVLCPAALREASRLPSVSMQSTISSLTVDINPARPELSVAWVSLGQPARAPYVPVSLLAETTPRALVDGSLYTLASERETPVECLCQAEAEFVEMADDAITRAGTLLDRGDRPAAAAGVEAMSAACTAKAVEVLTAGR